MSSLDRKRIRNIVRTALEPLPFVHALWEGGSTAFGRDDVWSDVDLQVCVDDDRVDETFRVVERAFAVAHRIASTFAVPEPAWHGHAQRFYRFENTPPWLVLDLVVQKRSNERRLLEPEIHGPPVFLFDKIGLAASAQPLDPEQLEKKLRARIEFLQARVGMFAILVEKECRRRHASDAMGFYNALVLAPLVEFLRMRHDPWRHDFGMRYLEHVLPRADAKRFEQLVFVRHLDDLQVKHRTALRWIESLVDELKKTPKIVPRILTLKGQSTASPG